MTQPTHFIEVWKNDEGILYYNRYPEDIKYLEDAIRFTKLVRGTTIAVWKIKWKIRNKTN